MEYEKRKNIFHILMFPQRTTSSPSGCQTTLPRRAAGIGLSSSSSRLSGETTTPPLPSQVGATVTMTEVMRCRDSGPRSELMTEAPPSIMTLCRPSLCSAWRIADHARRLHPSSLLSVLDDTVMYLPPKSSRIRACFSMGWRSPRVMMYGAFPRPAWASWKTLCAAVKSQRRCGSMTIGRGWLSSPAPP